LYKDFYQKKYKTEKSLHALILVWY